MVRTKVLEGGEQKTKIQIRERKESVPAVWDQNQQEGAGRLQGSSRTKKTLGGGGKSARPPEAWRTSASPRQSDETM